MIKSPIISTYIIKEILFSFLICFLFFFFVFFVNQILFIMSQLLKEDVPFKDVLTLVWYSLPVVLALSFPFGTLVGALMAIGKLSYDNEILACLSSGISYSKIYLPIILIGVFLSLISFVINDYLQPLGRVKTKQLRRELVERNPDLILKPYSTDIYEDRVIINGNVDKDKGIEDIIIIDRNEKGVNRVIMSNQARVTDGEYQQGIITLSLDNVFSISADKHNSDEFEYFTSSSMRYNILFSDMQTTNTSITPDEMRSIDIFKGVKRIQSEMDIRVEDRNRKNKKNLNDLKVSYFKELYDMSNVNGLKELSDKYREYEKIKNIKESTRELKRWQIGIYQKILIPLACLSFILLAFPLGLTSKRSGKMMGFGIGLGITIIYWALLMGAKIYATKITGFTFLIIATPNIFILLITAILIPIRFKK